MTHAHDDDRVGARTVTGVQTCALPICYQKPIEGSAPG